MFQLIFLRSSYNVCRNEGGCNLNNYLNVNEVFPILEMIRREIRKNNFNMNRDIGEEALFDPDDVSSVEIIRGGNSYDTELIDSIIVTYLDSATDTITLMRGANPQVPNTVPDYQYINNAMLSGFQVESSSEYDNRVTTCELVRENGYGKVVKVNLSYSN